MKLVELHLAAYGHFSDTRLVFSETPALHLIYGPNEAGKSTALRAITGLLYGIPVTTGDAHRHRTADLRIGARLQNGRSSLAVTRRKGNKNTLLDETGAPLPDTALDDFLGGVDAGTFRAMFGLDHESLRQGAEALLRGKGNVGESLFDAGVGGRGIQALLDDLNREADGLYRPRGQTQKINEALRELREAHKRRAAAELSAEAWKAQVDGLEHDRAERLELVAERSDLATEQSSLQRAQRVLPLLAKLRDLRERRAALGQVVPLAADARERRLAAQRGLDESRRQSGELRADVERLSAERERLAVPEALAELDESVIADLRDRLGEQRKAASDLPRRQGELERLRSDVAVLRQRLGSADVEELDRARIGPAAQARIVKLANERSGVRAALESSQRQLGDYEAKLARQVEAIEALPAPADTRALESALASVVQVADVPDQLLKLRRRWERECADLSRTAAALGLAGREPRELRALLLPVPERVESAAVRLAEAERRRAEQAAREAELARRERENERARTALDTAGVVPSEGALEEARRRRAQLWEDLRQFFARAEPPPEVAVRGFEEAVRAADDLADRLRREADRVAQRAALVAERQALQSERAALDRESGELAGEHAAARAGWEAIWNELGVAASDPAQMRGWLRRADEMVLRAGRAADLAAEMQETEEALRQRRDALRGALAALGSGPSPDESLVQQIEAARRLVAAAAALAQRRAECERSIDDLRHDIQGATREVESRRRDLEAWQRAWGESVAAIGLSAAATPEEAQAILDGRAELRARVDEMRHMEDRVAAMEADAGRYAEDVQRIASAHAPQLRRGDPLETAEQFLRLQRKAVADLQERRRLDREIADRQRALEENEERLAHAAREIEALLEAARVADVAALEKAETSAAAAADLDQKIAELEDQILSVGDGAGLEELSEQTSAIDADVARARLREIGERLEQLNERLRDLDTQIGRYEIGLEHLQQERGAAEAASEAEEKAASLAAHVQRYVRVKLAATMLDREIERYRRENQGPVLGRAAELFPRLTLGRYTSLRVGFDDKDEAVLLCVRDDGSEVHVEGLSDGTRDQLYLALRLATLERFAESNEPMPVILDDILIHFDDDRARAALQVLGDFAAKTQVLFFTHHTRLRDLAREVVPGPLLVEHRLGD